MGMPKCPLCGSSDKVKWVDTIDQIISLPNDAYNYSAYECTACDVSFNIKTHYKITPIDYRYDLD